MARGIEVKLNGRGIEELLKSGEVREDLTARAEKVLAAAQDDPHDDTYEYEQSLRIEQATTDRAAVRVVADAPHAWAVEANFGVLARALDAAGGS